MGPGLLAALLVACEPQMRGYDGAPIGCGPGSTMVAEICIATPLIVETALERIAEQTKKP